jgi:hypothetical protein
MPSPQQPPFSLSGHSFHETSLKSTLGVGGVVGVGVAVGGRGLRVAVGAGEGVSVGVSVGVGVAVGVKVGEGVAVNVGVSVPRGGCALGVSVGVAVKVGVGLGTGVTVRVGVGVGPSQLSDDARQPNTASKAITSR